MPHLTRRALATTLAAPALLAQSPKHYAVVGAGVFGAWSAYHLLRSGHKVTLIDQYGPANSRASSGGESRIIRARYGKDVLYARSALRAITLWTEFFARINRPQLFQRTGALWMARENDPRLSDHVSTLRSLGATIEEIPNRELRRRYPQINIDSNIAGILEPNAGGLMARQAVQAVVAQFLKEGGTYRQEQILTPATTGKLASLRTASGATIAADEFLFAAGPWLKTLLPDVLSKRITPTRQVVVFLAPPPGDSRFAAPLMPCWGDAFSDLPWYGLPDLESRGFKIAFGWLGKDFDPDSGSRFPEPSELERVRAYTATRFPALAQAPIVETRICQYENTANVDFLVDQHPAHANLWIAGGGSGHGFKHGPAIGEHIAHRILGRIPAEPRFSLASKAEAEPVRTAQRP